MFRLNDYLRTQADAVNRELERRLPAVDARPAALHAAMHYSLFPGGKRLRPILCLAAAAAAAPRPSTAVRAAAMDAALAVEVLHTYTLVHDDLPCMDDDDERRGKPTVHRAFGEANAVLCGDALQALAFAWAANAERARRGTGARLVAELASAAGSTGVVGGQVEDIAALNQQPTREVVDFVHMHKTADLFRAAVCMGGIAAGASRLQLAALRTYGESLGLAFQITDDLLDAPAAGHPAPEELSCLAVMSPAEARRLAQRQIADACSALTRFAPTARRPLDAIARAVLRRRN